MQDPRDMLHTLGHEKRLSVRKALLFAAGCLRLTEGDPDVRESWRERAAEIPHATRLLELEDPWLYRRELEQTAGQARTTRAATPSTSSSRATTAAWRAASPSTATTTPAGAGWPTADASRVDLLPGLHAGARGLGRAAAPADRTPVWTARSPPAK